jgi:hypothetical protein
MVVKILDSPLKKISRPTLALVKFYQLFILFDVILASPLLQLAYTIKIKDFNF